MKKNKFKYGWIEKRRFLTERKHQIREGIHRYDGAFDKNSTTYWQVTGTLPPIDIDQKDVLSEFSKRLVLKEK